LLVLATFFLWAKIQIAAKIVEKFALIYFLKFSFCVFKKMN
jgi:hypothetical protein